MSNCSFQDATRILISHMKIKISNYWLFQLVGWTSLLFISYIIAFTFNKANNAFFISLTCSSLLGILITHIMRIHIHKLDLLKQKITYQIVGFVMIAILYSIIYGTLVELVDFYILHYKPSSVRVFSLGKRLFLSSFNSLWILVIWIFIYYIYHYYQRNRTQELDTFRLENLVKSLQLKTIKSHINPHFIFNALNSIRALVDENPERARKAITELSNILRSSLNSDQKETVLLKDELEIVEDYLALEQMRFEERLRVEMDIDFDTLYQYVPPMMLQTLVENAIKHGISKKVQGGNIRVRSIFKDDSYIMMVENTGQLEAGKPDDNGFGLKSTKERLQLMYAENAALEINNLNNTEVLAKITLPINVTQELNLAKN